MDDKPVLIDRRVVGSRRRTAMRRARVELDRRLWDLEEVTEILNRGSIDGRRPRYNAGTVRTWITRGELPVVVLPPAWASDNGRTGWRNYRVPDVWVENWFAMRDRAKPLLTAREDVSHPDDPPWVSLNDAGLSVGLSHETMFRLVRLGIVDAHSEPSGTRVISTRTLDDWVFRLIRLAEEEWYAEAGKEAVGG